MKLIFCSECQDVRKLDKFTTWCKCGKSWGWYNDNGLDAVICGKAIPLGFANGSFVSALNHRPEAGFGERFEAFVIPKKCSSVIDETDTK